MLFLIRALPPVQASCLDLSISGSRFTSFPLTSHGLHDSRFTIHGLRLFLSLLTSRALKFSLPPVALFIDLPESRVTRYESRPRFSCLLPPCLSTFPRHESRVTSHAQGFPTSCRLLPAALFLLTSRLNLLPLALSASRCLCFSHNNGFLSRPSLCPLW